MITSKGKTGLSGSLNPSVSITNANTADELVVKQVVDNYFPSEEAISMQPNL